MAAEEANAPFECDNKPVMMWMRKAIALFQMLAVDETILVLYSSSEILGQIEKLDYTQY